MPSRISTARPPAPVSSRPAPAPAEGRPSTRSTRTVSPADTFSGATPRGTTARSTVAPLPSLTLGTSAQVSPNAAIPDRGTITSRLSLNDAVTIDKLSLNLDLQHTWRGDLKVTLTSPSGKSVVVHNRTGGSADDLKGTFDLSGFAGEPAKGEWTLTVADEARGDVGVLKSWKLSATGARPRPTDNEFRSTVGGMYPPVAAGSFFTQLKQARILTQLSLSAQASVASRGMTPSDFEVRAKLRSLDVMLPTQEATRTTRHDFSSRIEGVAPEKAYEHFVQNPGQVFGAADLKVRPGVGRLEHGQRLMLEAPGSPSVWFPVEVRLDPAQRTIGILTLDGHPLRGTNDFSFTSDGRGGTRVEQLTRYQLSSKAAELGMDAAALRRQHDTWQKVHAHFFTQFHPGA
jgi:subtilisin-like proprotein convertase family protein